ncbi:MAG TPA: Fic family protein [Daejeonella sp.]|nr:Fic family protein [Daejeonella sp.]
MLLHSIALQEAKMSSEIENVMTTNDELYQALAADKIVTDPSTKEVLHYQSALWEGFSLVKEKGFLSTNLFIRLYNIIKKTEAGVRTITGTKISNHSTSEIIYTPPEGQTVINVKLKNLEDFINNPDDDIDPLIKMAIMHYQFEAIHPFSDGNGRTGRILNILYLVNQDLLELPILYLSKYIIENKAAYYSGLRSVTENNKWEEWVLYMLHAVEKTALYTQQKIDGIVKLMYDTEIRMKAEAPDIYSKDLLDIIFRMPYSKRKSLEGLVSLKTAGQYLNKLVEKQFLIDVKVGKEKLYINMPLFNLLKS